MRFSVQIFAAGKWTSFPWPRGTKEIVLPLLVAQATQSTLTVTLRDGAAQLELEDIAVVATGDDSRALAFEISAPRHENGVWLQDLRPREAATLPPRSVFVARMHAQAPLAGPVEIEMSAQDGTRKLWSFGALAPDAGIVLDPRAVERERDRVRAPARRPRDRGWARERARSSALRSAPRVNRAAVRATAHGRAHRRLRTLTRHGSRGPSRKLLRLLRLRAVARIEFPGSTHPEENSQA
jgi:hypothetical protein